MDTHQLEVFITAAQYLNFTQAAKRLNMVPSAVSHNIAMLESELSTKLFLRNKNKISLTVEGKLFLADAYKITNITNNAISRIQFRQSTEIGELQIGFVFPSFIERFLPQMTSFYKKHPSIDTFYMQYDSVKLSRMLEKNIIDIAFGRKEMFASTQIRWKSLYRDPFKVIMHHDNPLSLYSVLTPKMLCNQQIFVMNRESNPDMFDMINHLFLSNGIVPHLNDHSNHHATTLLHAAMNAGIVVIPFQNFCHMKLDDNLIYRDLNDPMAFHEIGIAWNITNENLYTDLFLSEFDIYDIHTPEPL